MASPRSGWKILVTVAPDGVLSGSESRCCPRPRAPRPCRPERAPRGPPRGQRRAASARRAARPRARPPGGRRHPEDGSCSAPGSPPAGPAGPQAAGRRRADAPLRAPRAPARPRARLGLALGRRRRGRKLIPGRAVEQQLEHVAEVLAALHTERGRRLSTAPARMRAISDASTPNTLLRSSSGTRRRRELEHLAIPGVESGECLGELFASIMGVEGQAGQAIRVPGGPPEPIGFRATELERRFAPPRPGRASLTNEGSQGWTPECGLH